MSDPYLLEPAKSGRARCKVSKELIEKGELRFGSLVDIGGHASYQWRKLGCITAKQVANLKAKMGGIPNVGGFAAVSAKQQAQFLAACKKAEATGEKVDKAKAKIALHKLKAKEKKEKAKVAKVAMKAKALAAKEAKEAKAISKKPASSAAAADTNAGDAPPAKRGRASSREADAAVVSNAHKAIDHAKNGKWRDLFAFLDKHPEVVNVRPENREYGIIHQAAFLGSQLAVDQLVDKYGADLKAKTKSGATAKTVASEHDHRLLAKHITEKPSRRR